MVLPFPPKKPLRTLLEATQLVKRHLSLKLKPSPLAGGPPIWPAAPLAWALRDRG